MTARPPGHHDVDELKQELKQEVSHCRAMQNLINEARSKEKAWRYVISGSDRLARGEKRRYATSLENEFAKHRSKLENSLDKKMKGVEERIENMHSHHV